MSSPSRAYQSSGWRQIRALVLRRDAWLCQIRGPRCLGRADTVDHVIPTSQGGAFWDPDNLRASCHRCNYGRGAELRNANAVTRRRGAIRL